MSWNKKPESKRETVGEKFQKETGIPYKPSLSFDEIKALDKSFQESFRWFVPENFSFVDYSPKSVKVKLVALTADTVSKNNRRYIVDEIKKSARTLIGRPICVNHDEKQIIGNVEWAEEEDGNLEAVGIIKKQPYVDMIRNKDKRIRGLSVGAKYLKLKCKCGQTFNSEDDFKAHLATAPGHLGAGSNVYEPRGIYHEHLALVVGDEIPGVSTTQIEAFETVEGMNRLFECIINERSGQKTVLEVKEKETSKLGEKVEKRGDQWCVVHCSGPDAGEPIKCFDTEAEAEAMHAAIQSDKEGETKAEPKQDAETSDVYEMVKARTQILAAIEAVHGEVKRLTEDHEATKTRIQTLEEQNRQRAELKETEGFTEKLQNVTTRLDNLEDKIKPQFKGVSKQLSEQEAEPGSKNLEKLMRAK